MTERLRMSGPADVVRGVARLAMALVGLGAIIGGVAWLLDGGTERWLAYLANAALALVPGSLLLVGWRGMHRAAGIRATTAARDSGRRTAHNGWRIEVALVGALLSLAAVAALVGAGVWSVAAAQRLSWNEIRATYAGSETRDTEDCAFTGCPVHYRLVGDGGTAVFVDTPGKFWPSDDALPGAEVSVWVDPDDPETASAYGPRELGLGALLVFGAGVTVGGAAWTLLSDAGKGPEPPPPHTFRG